MNIEDANVQEIVTDVQLLKKISDPVKNTEHQSICKTLIDAIPQNALGLSAPQINIFQRAFIANFSFGQFVFINPSITHKSPDVIPSIEGCLSLPDITKCVPRHNQIEIDADAIYNSNLECVAIRKSVKGSLLPETGQPIEEIYPIFNDDTATTLFINMMKFKPSGFDGSKPIRLKSLDSCIFQHELDHLNGILITDLPMFPTRQEKYQFKSEKRQEKIRNKKLNKKDKNKSDKNAELSKEAKKELKRLENQMRKRAEIRQQYLLEKNNIIRSNAITS